MAAEKAQEQAEGLTRRRTRRYQWTWRHLDFGMRLALFFAHRLPRVHADRKRLAQVIREMARQARE